MKPIKDELIKQAGFRFGMGLLNPSSQSTEVKLDHLIKLIIDDTVKTLVEENHPISAALIYERWNITP